MAVEYRLRWRRPGWRATTYGKTRVLQRRSDLLRAMAKLVANGPAEITVEVREVGPWREVGTP